MRTLEEIMSGIEKVHLGRGGSEEWIRGDKANRYQWAAMLSARCNLDFPFFCKNVLGLNFIYPSKLNDVFHFEPVKYIFNKRFILIIWPRGHLKTSIWGEAYPLWRIWREKNFKAGVVSSALDQSQKSIENMEKMILNNEFLSNLYDNTLKWNTSEFVTANGNQCTQLPFNSTSRGKHLNLLIADDILREENLSQEQIKDYFWSIFFPMTQTLEGQTIMIGTPMTMKDLFAELQNPPADKKELLAKYNLDCQSIKKACVIVDDNGKWLEPVWPERYKTIEELEAIKALQGSLIFEREFMCNPMGGGASIFKTIIIGKHSEIDKALPTEEYFIGVDVAMKGGPKNDFLVYSILGKDLKTNMVKQRKMERYKGWGTDEIIQRLKILNQKFHPKTIMIENTGLGIGLVKDLQNKEKYPDLYDVVEGFVSNKRINKEEIISAISVGFETNVLSVLDNTIQYNELISFKAKEDTRSGRITYEGVGEHDDTVIALGLAMLGIQLQEFGTSSIAFI